MSEVRQRPLIETLEPDACKALLARHHVGRLAYSFRDRVDIEPIHYVYVDDRIYGRTQMGAKVDVLAHHPWVAFEVDEVQTLFDWQSVVVHGRITFPDPEGPPSEREQFAKGVAAFQALLPDAFTDADPTPDRDLVFCLHVQEMNGRVARVRGAKGTAHEDTNG